MSTGGCSLQDSSLKLGHTEHLYPEDQPERLLLSHTERELSEGREEV